MNVIRIVLALFLPSVAAFLTVGIGLHFWPNLVLPIVFFVPGTIHTLWLVVGPAQGTPGRSRRRRRHEPTLASLARLIQIRAGAREPA